MFDTEPSQAARSEAVPRGLDEMQPGPELAGMLADIDVREVSGYDQVVVLRAHQRLASHYAAQVYADMAAITRTLREVEADLPIAHEQAAAEIRVALQLTRRASDVELDLALDLHERLPGVWDRLAAGDLDVRRARTIVKGTEHLSIGSAREIAERALEVAPRLTTGQLAARLRRLCIETDSDEARTRYLKSVEDRKVVTEPATDGTVHVFGLGLPPDRVAAATRRINRLARSLRSNGDPRTMDQLRADVFLDLLQGHTPAAGSNRGVVDIHVDLTTLAGLADHPGELAGYGPVIADLARRVALRQSEAEWRFTITDPSTGQLVHHGITRRRPTTRQKREIQAHHRTCVFPGCRMPAAECDIDHRIPHSEGGPTHTSNLAPLCRHDHHVRTAGGWTHELLPNGGHRWTTRLGHTYLTERIPP